MSLHAKPLKTAVVSREASTFGAAGPAWVVTGTAWRVARELTQPYLGR